MAKKFQHLRDKMSPEARAKSERIYREMLRDMSLRELRKAQGLTQTEVAQLLGIMQASVSKIERQADTYVSTLRRFIEACGGHLVIRAEFPSGMVEVNQFAAETEAPEATA